ncbi:MAG: hypothetical protein QOI62_3987 [Solirubrobacteraceae bacterium]|nr:hypothetical protein [Solirubrobacteraceae bacterium]MEA2277098.1 hypothetical protein [Solirubrobacteraceae bacterium]MEA2360727.1 hypothetical protein [Solirubrobacteraceae bacterium]
MLRSASGGMNGATNGSPHAAGFFRRWVFAYTMCRRRWITAALPTLSVAVTFTVKWPECR